jgi:hypothetical protein
MRRFTGFLLFAAVPVLGFVGATWFWLFGAALAGVIGYWLIHPVVFTRMRKACILRGSIYPLTTYIAAVYISQLVVCFVLFLTGRGFGLLLGG